MVLGVRLVCYAAAVCISSVLPTRVTLQYVGINNTILWHVNDLKILHVDSNAVSNVLSDIDAEYEKLKNDHPTG